MMEFIIFIGGVIILFSLFELRGRVLKLEELVKHNISERKTKSADQSQQSEIQQTATISSEQTDRPESKQSGKFVEWLKEDWLLKLGAMLLLIGFGWLTTYAFLNNWIGPMGRISLGIVAGACFILLGWWRIQKYITQGGIFLVLGSTTILLTIFAARMVYDFFTPISALVVMFLSTAFVALASVKYNNRALSLLSLVLAGIAPLLTKSPATDHVGLFAYLFVVTLGAIWIVALTGQKELTVASLVIIILYSAPHLISPLSFPLADIQVLLLFAYAFSVLFFLTNIASIFKLKEKKIVDDLIIAAGNGLFLLAWVMAAAQDEWKSLIISAWMVVFAVGAFLVFKITQRRETFYVYAGVGIAMLAAATSAELDGATLTIAYTIESGIISFIVYSLLRDIQIAKKTSLLLIGPALLSLESIDSDAWESSVINKDFFVLLILSLTFFGLGLFFLWYIKKNKSKESQRTSVTLLITGSIYSYILLWLSLHSWFNDENTAVMISLVIYTIIGLISYLYGVANKKRALHLYGGALVGFVVGRLLLVDIWNMELAGRIITFFLIGTMLLSTAFLGRKKQDDKVISKSNNI